MATTKSDDQIMQPDNKLELETSVNWDQGEIETKSGKFRIGHDCVVTLHDAYTNDDITFLTDLHIDDKNT